ncbi:MAG TPA: hypothetical protein VFP33_11625 [Gallionella sp.]|nr:hypothetical protein [Gallionella sp.]
MLNGRNRFILMPLALMLGACSSFADLASKIDPTVKSASVAYKEPDGNTGTRLRVVSSGIAKLIPDRACDDWLAPGGGVVVSHVFGLGIDNSLNNKKIGIPKDGEIKNSSEVYIRPKQPIVIAYDVSETLGTKTWRCIATGYFIPEENTDYQALTGGTGQRCFINLSKIAIDKTSNAVTYIPVKLEESKDCKR